MTSRVHGKMKFKRKKYMVCFIVFLCVFFMLQISVLTELQWNKFQGNQSKPVLNILRWKPKIFAADINKSSTPDLDKGVVSTCIGTTLPLHVAEENTWCMVNRDLTAYVFAAYHVETTNELTVIGIKSRFPTYHSYICQLWYQTKTPEKMAVKEVKASLLLMYESHGLEYSGVIFQCQLDQAVTAYPTHVSLVTEACQKPLHLLRIRLLRNRPSMTRKFTVCLSPLNFRYDRYYEMIEWVELNRILGADKFIIYNYSSGSNVARVLDYYSKRGLVEVVQWNIPVGVDTWPREKKSVEIHYFGQSAALNDCLYRNKFISEIIVNIDLDEFIIPQAPNVTSWEHMLTRLDNRHQVYLFSNTFFRKEWDNAEVTILNKSVVDKLKLVTLQKLQHERKIFTPPLRSKYFAKTNDVSKVMTHTVPNVKRMEVPVEVGLLHHYRNWEIADDPPYVKILDKTIPNKFGNRLIKNVQKVWSDLDIRERM